MEVVSSIQKNDIEIDLTSEDVIIEDQNSQMEIEIEHSEQNNEEKTR